MDLIMKLNIVNKHEYEEQEDYREIILKIPNQRERMERDFRYLGLDYNNLSIQDTHILNCEVIDKTDPSFSGAISTEISNIISRAKDLGYTTPFQDIKKLFTIINTFNSIPAQLSKRNKKFLFSEINEDEENVGERKYTSAMEWLKDAGIINFCYNFRISPSKREQRRK